MGGRTCQVVRILFSFSFFSPKITQNITKILKIYDILKKQNKIFDVFSKIFSQMNRFIDFDKKKKQQQQQKQK